MSGPHPDPAADMARLEKGLGWRLLPTVVFIGALAVLLVAAVVSLVAPKRHPRGLPDDPDVIAAAADVAGRVSVRTNALRWRAALLGGEPANAAPDRAMLERVAGARERLRGARHGGDARVLAARAALDLAAHDFTAAIRRYRRACELAPHFGEGRLGAGVALALEADRTSEPWQARALRLQAAAQFAMVDSLDAEYALALYDRARVLRDVGREAEARFWAARAAAAEPGGPWSEALRRDGLLGE
jgi:tetratricopeptide (TPR) repeat protein